MATRGSHKQVDLRIVQEIITGLGERFSTRDVADDARMQAGHPALVQHRNYNAFVGRAISEDRSVLGLIERKKGTARGSVWEKTSMVRRPPVQRQTPAGLDLGPQSASDSVFKARMRRHQSWYRKAVLGVPCGTGPYPKSTTRYGNMLTHADGAQGLNFLTTAAFDAAKERVVAGGGAVDPFRLFHNMLSSMPMCFNLFGPLVEDLDLARRLVGALLPGEVAEVVSVRLEHAPQPASDYLDDGTSFDTFIEYRRPDGALAGLGVECKLTEPFSKDRYDRPAYRRWMHGPRSPWRQDAHASVAAVRHNQLWRDHLLAVAVRDRPGSPYAACRLALVRHPEDNACSKVVAGYQALLKPGDDTFVEWPLNTLLDRWTAAGSGAQHAGWLGELRRRYLDLHLSEG